MIPFASQADEDAAFRQVEAERQRAAQHRAEIERDPDRHREIARRLSEWSDVAPNMPPGIAWVAAQAGLDPDSDLGRWMVKDGAPIFNQILSGVKPIEAFADRYGFDPTPEPGGVRGVFHDIGDALTTGTRYTLTAVDDFFASASSASANMDAGSRIIRRDLGLPEDGILPTRGYKPGAESLAIRNPLETTQLYQHVANDKSLGSGFFPRQGDAYQEAVRAQRRQWGTINGSAASWDRVAAAKVFEPGSRPYHAMSGLLAATAQVVGDPLNVPFDELAQIRQARRTFAPAGLYEGTTRRWVDPRPASQWLDSRPGQQVQEFFRQETSFREIWRRTNKQLPVRAVAELQDASTLEDVRKVLEPLLGIEVRNVPKWGYEWRRPYENLRWANQLPAGEIDFDDIDAAVEQFDRLLTTARVDPAEIDELVAKAARAQDRTELFDAVVRDGGEAMARSVKRFGADDETIRRVTTFFYEDWEEQRRLFIDEMGNTPHVPAALVDGEVVPMVGPHLPSELLNRAIPLPDPRELRRVATHWSGVWDIPGVAGSVTFMDFVSNGIFKPGALMRLAWPVRVLGEEAVRMQAAGYRSALLHPMSFIAKVVGRSADDVDVLGRTFKELASDPDAAAFKALSHGQGKWGLGVGSAAYPDLDRIALKHQVQYRRGASGYIDGWGDELSHLSADPVTREVARAIQNPAHVVGGNHTANMLDDFIDTFSPSNYDTATDAYGIAGRVVPDDDLEDLARAAKKTLPKPPDPNYLENTGTAKTGLDALSARLELEINKRGKALGLSRHDLDEMRQFARTIGEDLFEGTRLSLRKSLDASGQYEFGSGLIRINTTAISQRGFNRVMLHEMWHHLSQFVPDDAVKHVEREFAKARRQFIKKNPWAAHLGDDWGRWFTKAEREGSLADAPDEMFTKKMRRVGRDVEESYRLAVSDETYRLFNLDEFFAERMYDLTLRRMAPDHPIWDTAVRVFARMWDSLRRVFGGDSTRAMFDDFWRSRYGDQVRRTPLDPNANAGSAAAMARRSADEPQPTGLDAVAQSFWDGSLSRYRLELVKSGGWRARLADRDFADWYIKHSVTERIHIKTGGNGDLLDLVVNGRFDKNTTGLLKQFADEGIGPEIVKGQAFTRMSPNASEAVARGWNRFVSGMFSVLMSKPTNWLHRSETFKQAYWRRLRELMPYLTEEGQQQILRVAGNYRLSDDTMRALRSATRTSGDRGVEQIDTIAKAFALDETKKLLYDVTERGHFFDAWRIVFPFGEAWKEVITRWAHLAAENPKVVRRAQQGITGARQSGFFYTDPDDGQEYFTFPFSRELTRRVAGVPFDMRGRVSGLNIIGQGLPGVGPVIQIPASRIIPDRPSWDAVREFISPYGDPEVESGVFEAFFPGWVQKLRGAGVLEPIGFGPTPGQERIFENSVIDVMNYKMSTGAYDPSDPVDLARLEADARRDAKRLAIWRSAAQSAAPTAPQVIPNITTKNGQLVELWVMARDYRKMLDDDYDTATLRFIDKYGPLAFGVMEPKGRRTVYGIPTTKEAAWWASEHSEFVSAYRNVYGFFAPQGGERDYNAYLRALERGEIEPLDGGEWIRLANARVGNAVYARLRDRAGPNPNAAQRDVLAREKDRIREEHPGFDDDSLRPSKASVDTLVSEFEKAITHPDVAGTDLAQGIKEYLQLREMALDRVPAVTRGKAKTLRSRAAEPLRAWLRGKGAAIIEETPEFRLVWDYVFSREVEVLEEEG